MNPAEYERMHQLEDWYWWFVSRREAAIRFLRDALSDQARIRVLDAGCGTGGMLDLFSRTPGFESTGADICPDALRFCRNRGHTRLVAADLTALPFESESFDAVTSLDVLEHIEADFDAAGEIARVLRPGGVLVAIVPAYQFLWGPHDVALHHKRRYGAGQLPQVLERAGLKVERETFLLTLLFPAAVAARMLARWRHRGDQAESAGLPPVSAALNRLLIRLQAAELALARRCTLKFGLSIVVVARKPLKS